MFRERFAGSGGLEESSLKVGLPARTGWTLGLLAAACANARDLSGSRFDWNQGFEVFVDL